MNLEKDYCWNCGATNWLEEYQPYDFYLCPNCNLGKHGGFDKINNENLPFVDKKQLVEKNKKIN